MRAHLPKPSSPVRRTLRRPARDDRRPRRAASFSTTRSTRSPPPTTSTGPGRRGAGPRDRLHHPPPLESTDRNYFYSAMLGDRCIVRSAKCLLQPLGEVLAADREFLWFMLGVTLLMSVAGYFAHAPPEPEHHAAEQIRRTRRAGRADRRTHGFPPRRAGRHFAAHHPPLRTVAKDHRRPRPQHALALHEDRKIASRNS